MADDNEEGTDGFVRPPTLSPLTQTIMSGNSSPRGGLYSMPFSPESKRNMLQKPLSYDAPERVFVNQKDIGIQADVWSLGVIMYEFLA